MRDRRADLALEHTVARALEHDVEVHTVDAGRRVVLDAEIDVLLDAEAEVACQMSDRRRERNSKTTPSHPVRLSHAHTNSRTHGREVALVELELLDLEALLKDLLGLLATDNYVRGDLLVTADAE